MCSVSAVPSLFSTVECDVHPAICREGCRRKQHVVRGRAGKPHKMPRKSGLRCRWAPHGSDACRSRCRSAPRASARSHPPHPAARHPPAHSPHRRRFAPRLRPPPGGRPLGSSCRSLRRRSGLCRRIHLPAHLFWLTGTDASGKIVFRELFAANRSGRGASAVNQKRGPFRKK